MMTVESNANAFAKKGRTNILRIHAKSMSAERDIRFELIARLCPNATGAELRSVSTEAGMYAIRARRKVTISLTSLRASSDISSKDRVGEGLP